MKEGSVYREFFTLGYPLPDLNLLKFRLSVTDLWSVSTGAVAYLVSVNWWYRLSETRAKSILDAWDLLSQEYWILLGYWVLQGSTRAWSSMLVVRYLCVLGLWYLILWFLLSRVVFCTTLKSPM